MEHHVLRTFEQKVTAHQRSFIHGLGNSVKKLPRHLGKNPAMAPEYQPKLISRRGPGGPPRPSTCPTARPDTEPRAGRGTEPRAMRVTEEQSHSSVSDCSYHSIDSQKLSSTVKSIHKTIIHCQYFARSRTHQMVIRIRSNKYATADTSPSLVRPRPKYYASIKCL